MSWSEINLKKLFLQDTPLIDVRAPIEFKDGHFPCSINLPLMNDEERHLIGIEYKKLGQLKAIELGHKLVSGETKENRISDWVNFLKINPNAQLYCFRGGMRSQIATEWIADRGIKLEKITGGYKALRQFLLNTLEEKSKVVKLVVISGRTGTGKTPFLYQTNLPMIDLEKLANHRGSSFGGMGPQPTPINFENKGPNVCRIIGKVM